MKKTQRALDRARKDRTGRPSPGRRASADRRASDALPRTAFLWYKQLADTISAAVQSGKCADGDKRLQSLYDKLLKNEADKNLAAYVKFRQLMATYGLSLQAPKADIAKIQTDWPKSLEQYIADYPTSPDAAEAMLQLGITREYAGQEDDAKKWYCETSSTTYADSPQAKKAAGAATRLDSVGKTISLVRQEPGRWNRRPVRHARQSGAGAVLGHMVRRRPRRTWPH